MRGNRYCHSILLFHVLLFPERKACGKTWTTISKIHEAIYPKQFRNSISSVRKDKYVFIFILYYGAIGEMPQS